jgi:hypothetical protein
MIGSRHVSCAPIRHTRNIDAKLASNKAPFVFCDFTIGCRYKTPVYLSINCRFYPPAGGCVLLLVDEFQDAISSSLNSAISGAANIGSFQMQFRLANQSQNALG